MHNTISAKQFIAERTYRDALHKCHANIYDAMIERFTTIPDHLLEEGEHSLTEVGSFLIQQGNLVEVLQLEYEAETVFAIDIAYEPDAHGLTHLSNGSAQEFQLRLRADSFEDAVKGIAEIMLNAHSA